MDRLHVAAHTARKPHAKQKRNPSPDHAHLQKQRMNRLVLSSKLHGMQQYGRALSWPRITTQPRKKCTDACDYRPTGTEGPVPPGATWDVWRRGRNALHLDVLTTDGTKPCAKAKHRNAPSNDDLRQDVHENASLHPSDKGPLKSEAGATWATMSECTGKRKIPWWTHTGPWTQIKHRARRKALCSRTQHKPQQECPSQSLPL